MKPRIACGNPRRIKKKFHFKDTDNPETYFGLISNLYRISEIYKLAANLALVYLKHGITKIEIRIRLVGMKNRMLFINNFLRDLYKPYICKMKKIELPPQIYDCKNLTTNYATESLALYNDVLLKFNWEKPAIDVLVKDQKKFLSGDILR